MLGPDTVSESGSQPMYASNQGAWVARQLSADFVRAGVLSSDSFVANSTRVATVSIVGATATAIFDFANPAVTTAFPAGCNVLVQWNDGTQAPGGGISGHAIFGIVGANKQVVFGTQGWSGSEAGVTGVLLNSGGPNGSILNVTMTGKTTTTTGIFSITRVA
jgi:hypothetical protein